jgi:hypothetical protein
MIDGGVPLRKKVLHLFQNFPGGNIFLPLEGSLRRFANLAIDTIVGADLGGDEIDSQGPAEPPGRDWTIKIAIRFHLEQAVIIPPNPPLGKGGEGGFKD